VSVRRWLTPPVVIGSFALAREDLTLVSKRDLRVRETLLDLPQPADDALAAGLLAAARHAGASPGSSRAASGRISIKKSTRENQ
jgi:hypothetical protein